MGMQPPDAQKSNRSYAPAWERNPDAPASNNTNKDDTMDFKIDPRISISHATQPTIDQKTKDLASLKKSSQEFETLFVMEMFKAMRKAVPEGGLFEKNQSTEIFTEMLDMETAKATTAGKGLGIAEAMYAQMADLIEKQK